MSLKPAEMIRENLDVFREFVNEFQNTGTIFSTSGFAAEKMVNPLREPRGAKNILEVGAGTGPVTVKILENLKEGDQLTICEINPRLMSHLRKRLENDPNYQRFQDRVEFFEGPIQQLPEDRKFDVIISALPFLNFDVDMVQEIFEKYKRLSSEDVVVTYYEYIGLRSLGKSVAPKNRKERIKELDPYLKDLFQHYLIDKVRVWLNVLPIYVYTLKFAEARA